jgi:hypothetical protein
MEKIMSEAKLSSHSFSHSYYIKNFLGCQEIFKVDFGKRFVIFSYKRNGEKFLLTFKKFFDIIYV